MKLILIVLMLLILSIPVFALDLTVGTEMEFLLNKDVRLKNLEVNADYSAQYYDIKADIPLGIVTISPKAGINTFSLDSDVPFIGPAELNGGVGWNIGIDAESKALETNYVDFSLVGSYRYSRTDVDEIDLGGLVIDNPIETILTAHQWEIGIRASKDLEKWIGLKVKPYLGVVYSDFKGDIDVNLSAVSLEENISARDNIGIRTGFSVEPIKDLNINLGVKLLDETAIIGSLTYKF